MSYQLFDLVTITTSGNLGIGTYVPSETLHVEGIAHISSNVGIGVLHPSHSLDIAGDVNIAHTGDGDALNVVASGNNAMTINSDGRVGFGTESPMYDCDFRGVTAINNTLYLKNGNANVMFKSMSRHVSLGVARNTLYWIGFNLSWTETQFPINNFTVYGTMHASDSVGTGFASRKFSALINVVGTASKAATLDSTSMNSGVFALCPAEEVAYGTSKSCTVRVGVRTIDDTSAIGADFKMFFDVKIVADASLGDFTMTPYTA